MGCLDSVEIERYAEDGYLVLRGFSAAPTSTH